jgi:hypothetical protein
VKVYHLGKCTLQLAGIYGINAQENLKGVAMDMLSQISSRTCGSCTACCKALEVREINKPRAKWCEHCAIGSGCAIYPERPLSCQEFRCEWLKGFGTERDRPDRTKVIPDYVKPEGGLTGGIFQLWELTEGSTGSTYAKRITLLGLTNKIWVSHIPLHGRMRIFVPKSQAVTEEIAAALESENITITPWPRA